MNEKMMVIQARNRVKKVIETDQPIHLYKLSEQGWSAIKDSGIYAYEALYSTLSIDDVVGTLHRFLYINVANLTEPFYIKLGSIDDYTGEIVEAIIRGSTLIGEGGEIAHLEVHDLTLRMYTAKTSIDMLEDLKEV
ncbi:hypothetical protein E5F05_01885 (plasmid) [Deinococcus metallilatus]|uniref:Uncharacterized protein n=1 Tax=Deinococcus metallilatus TaxID=1211322 RepID=A0ABR6MZX9_9DEIO|nr:hypothetical protein [Deinococcus metallilatus]MBB5297473.1 hypothetical protein [Deinococcus metallilatus]QBY06724.1 hypothetical protein E5F05_01885 [Deinococcus metallilatus]GMA14375.1 hypothetical protein GCM10025871_07060 [Deinococcus metallilatus]